MSIIRQPDILIVEDDLENLIFLSTILRQSNYKVRPAINGKVALRAISLSPPDLLLLDIYLPDISGYDICNKLKSDIKTQHIPIIFISACNEAVDKVKAFSMGGVDYISKPFEITEVLARIETQLNMQHAQTQMKQLNAELEQRVWERTAELERVNALLEQRVQERTAQLSMTNQELEAFAYTLSHDLQVSLSIILSSSEILKLKYTDQFTEQICRHLDRINTTSLQMREHIKTVLDLHRLNHIQLQYTVVNLSEIVQQIVNNLKEIAPNRLSELRIEAGLMAWGDKVLLRIVLENLLSNAWKYSATRKLSQIDFGVLTHTDPPIFYIRDNGVGFDSTQAPDLFKPFHRMHSAKDFSGTGIGLASVKKIILMHGGEIRIDSKVDQGTTVYFSLQSSVSGFPQFPA